MVPEEDLLFRSSSEDFTSVGTWDPMRNEASLCREATVASLVAHLPSVQVHL
jgi:hypothetical protein